MDAIMITGASSGIGRAVAILMSNRGYRCILIARDIGRLEDTLSAMRNPDTHIIIQYDLTDLEHYDSMFKIIKDKDVVLKGLVHCAGITKPTPLRTININNSIELFKIHYFSFIELVKWYAKKGVSEGGSIVGISSINVHIPQKCMTSYAAAKGAVEAACRSLAVELSEKGIRINTVVAGGINTSMGSEIADIKDTLKSTYENPVNRQLLGIGNPEQIASVIGFLLSEEASFITGREIYADGGLL